ASETKVNVIEVASASQAIPWRSAIRALTWRSSEPEGIIGGCGIVSCRSLTATSPEAPPPERRSRSPGQGTPIRPRVRTRVEPLGAQADQVRVPELVGAIGDHRRPVGQRLERAPRRSGDAIFDDDPRRRGRLRAL